MASLQEIAHESEERLRQASTSLDVIERSDIGSADAPGFTQTLALSAVADGLRRDLVQVQVYLSMLDIDDLRRRFVVRLVLTATASQRDSLLGDFQAFLRTVRPNTDVVA